MEAQVRSELTSQVLLGLAEVVRVPTEEQVKFYESLPKLFQFMTVMQREQKYENRMAAEQLAIERQIGGLFSVLSDLQERLAGLHPHACKILGILAVLREQQTTVISIPETRRQLDDILKNFDVGGGIRGVEYYLEYKALIDNFAEATRDWAWMIALEKWDKSQKFAKPRGGAPSKSPDIPDNPLVSTFDHFMIIVSKHVYTHGGKLTLDKNRGSGTAIDFLRIAAGHLPHGFVPAGILSSSDEEASSKGLARLQAMIRRGKGLATKPTTGQKPCQK
jgi:hypothetical protein